jgi:hypothetical protein
MKRFYQYLVAGLAVLVLVAPAAAATASESNNSVFAIGPPDVCTSSAPTAPCPLDLSTTGTRPLGAITFATGESQGQPSHPGSQFSEGVEQFHAFFDYQNLSDSDVLTGVWYRGGRTLLRQTTTLTDIFGEGPPSTGTVWFTARVHGGFTPGIYRLEISVNDRLVQVGEFRVKPVIQSPVFANVTFARSVNAPAGGVRYPITVSSRFSPGTGTSRLYAVFDYFGMSASTSWGWQLSREGVMVKQSRVQSWPAANSGSFALPLDTPSEPGVYDLDLFADGRWTQGDSFVVGDPTPPNNRLLSRDDFRSPATGWTVSNDRGGNEAYSNGRYLITLNSLDPYWGFSPQTFGDFVMEVDATPTSRYGPDYAFDGPVGDAFGVIVRSQDKDNFYAFLVATDGRYSAFHIKAGRLIWDTPWTLADEDVVKDGWQTSRLRVLAQGPDLRFYLNGRFVTRVTDAIWTSGQDGVLASNAYGDLFGGEKVGFSQWRVWSLPDESAPIPGSDPANAS